MDRLGTQGIERLSGAQSLAFVLGDNALFFGTGYKVLQNQQKSYLVQCARSRYNGKIKLTYFTKGLLPLGTFLLEADTSSCQKVMTELVRAVIDIRDNGFFSLQNILLGNDVVYVDAALGEPRVVYLPVTTSSSDRSDLQVVQQIYRFCMDAMTTATNAPVSLAGLCDTQGYKSGNLGFLLEVFRRRDVKEGKEASVQPSLADQPSGRLAPASGGASAVYSLKAAGRNSGLVIQISKPQTVLGKSPEKADIVIQNNPTVSRSHCRLIISSEGQLSVVDLTSSNGTFVNGARIHPNRSVPLPVGSRLALANLEFAVTRVR